ncbi:WD repeat-containing protein 89 [Copidosoma floridanum]|uniref:WD repeat-containing protein 89 n=1 Tax=Copidosoma floridanum TaxID=29053 RepID=UPI0006C9CA9A|nr:WD repeat-containing protein 89 [Copidosoma floridanum]
MAKIVESLKKLSVENGVSSQLSSFNYKAEFVPTVEERVSLDEQNYVLALCGTQSDDEFKIGAALADHTCVIYSAGEQFRKLMSLEHNQSSVVGIKFSPSSRHIVYIASSDGTVSVCDLRAKGKVIAQFKDNTEDGKLKPLASFDISCDERLVAGGTEHIGGDAFILFWDVRYSNSKVNAKNSLLGGYWESHMDDITSLSFHWNKKDILASGSTDGLINVFDLTQTCEDSALTYSLNTESSVDRIGWLTNENLWCITHTHTIQLWNCEDATPYNKFERSHLCLSPKDDPESYYFVRIHAHSTFGNPYLIAGLSSPKGDDLKCLSLGKNCLEPYYDFSGNKQLVRDSWLHEKSGCLVTGGEAGIINIWRQTESLSVPKNTNNKRPAKTGAEKSRNDKNHRIKPY